MAVARSYIDEIGIQNFKFFPKIDKPIKVDGKNLLLYGENGSGKSSIYWALYTLLECANKDDVEQIQKYFDSNPEEDERLTNIHLIPSSPNWVNPYIQVTMKDGTPPYYVSFDNTAINTNQEAQESNFSSNFITYRNLLSLYNFAHSEEIDLFWYFNYAFLPYVKFSPVTYWHKKKDGMVVNLTTDSASKIWDFVFKGPQRNLPNKQGNLRYPIGNEQQLIDYSKIVAGFKSGLQELITHINTEGNPILKDELGYNMVFKLELVEQPVFKGSRKRRNPFLLTQQIFAPPEYNILFKITEYEGIPNAVKRAHSFLNEARLTAVGLAIRLAVLKKSLSEDAKLKMLILDDLLISLDMSNREKVINLILNKYIKDYQVFLLTHDRVMFEDTLRHIELFHKAEAQKAGVTDEEVLKKVTSDKWCVLEMYQAIDKSNIPKPFITESLSNIGKALFYFREQVDYNSCGNNLRAALEEFFIEFIPVEYRDDKTMLMGLVNSARTYFNYVGYDSTLLDKIDRYIKRSLNPTSHYNPKANYYRKELEDIFNIYFTLKLLKNKPLIAVNEKIKFSITTHHGNTYTYIAQFMADIRFYYKNDGTNNFLLNSDKRVYILLECQKNNEQPDMLSHRTSKFTLQELYDMTIAGIKSRLLEDPIVNPTMSKVFKNINDTTLDTLLGNAV